MTDVNWGEAVLSAAESATVSSQWHLYLENDRLKIECLQGGEFLCKFDLPIDQAAVLNVAIAEKVAEYLQGKPSK